MNPSVVVPDLIAGCDAASKKMPLIKAFVLAKNEEANIDKCLRGLETLGIETHVLDSGSTDSTIEKASAFNFVRVEQYNYISHFVAYKEICESRTTNDEFALVLDSDMVVTEELWKEILDHAQRPDTEVIQAPIMMYCAGQPLRFGSMCPPKPILFRGGKNYFRPVGHGEKLAPQVPVVTTRHKLIHDDRKRYDAYLLSQIRYSKNIVARAQDSNLSWKDRLRVNTPFMLAISPVFSLVFRLGLLSGKVGLLYAMDRLISEAIWFRQVLAERVRGMDQSNR